MVRIVRGSDDASQIVLDRETLERAGLREGDEVRVEIGPGTISVMSVRRVPGDEFDKAKDEVFDQYDDALRRLA